MSCAINLILNTSTLTLLYKNIDTKQKVILSKFNKTNPEEMISILPYTIQQCLPCPCGRATSADDDRSKCSVILKKISKFKFPLQFLDSAWKMSYKVV